MTDVQIYAGTLTASQNERTATGLLVPFGEECSSNLGRFRVDSGAFSVPADLTGIGLNVEHEREQVVGAVTNLTPTEQGVVATFSFAATPEGEQALADARAGKRARLSAEVAGVVIKNGKAIAGRIFGAALVKSGAFPSATLLAAAADTEGETHYETEYTDADGKRWRLVEDSKTTTEATDNGTTTTTVTTVTEETTPADEPETEQEEADVATAPSTLQAKATPAKATAPTYREMVQIMEAVKAGRASDTMLARLDGQFTQQNTLFAALNDITYDAAGSPVPYNPAPQWLGELYSGLQYQQIIAPLIGHADLTSKKLAAFRWVVQPAGADWTGNKAAVPSNTPTTEPYEVTADLFAGGHDHAIEHKLFNSDGYFDAYWRMMLESYAKWVDAKVISELLAEATTVEADDPTAVEIGAGLSAIIDGAAAVIAANAVPSFALVHPTLYKSILKTPNDTVLGYLNASLNLREGSLDGFQIKPATALSAGNVLVGAREAATLYELPGVPVRVEAPDTVKGGIDTNMFGAAAVAVHKADALQLVTPYTA